MYNPHLDKPSLFDRFILFFIFFGIGIIISILLYKHVSPIFWIGHKFPIAFSSLLGILGAIFPQHIKRFLPI